MIKRKQSGSIALTTVIIITAILLSGGITLLLTSIDLSNMRKGQTATTKAQFQYQSCLEEAVRRIKLNSSYTGTITVNPSGTLLCTAVVTNDSNPTNKVVVTTVTINNYTQEFTRKVSSTTLQIIE
jgi:hypothetical protein